MRIRKKLLSQEITDEEFFFSASFERFMATIIEGITKRYRRPVKARIVKNAQYVARTDNSEVLINYSTDWIKNAKNREEKFYIIIGLLLHEIGHLLYTDFDLMRDSMLCLAKGRFSPNIPISAELSKALDNGMGTILVPLYAEYDNIIEDGYIENAVLEEIPGYGECLTIVRHLHADDGCKTTYSDIKADKDFDTNEALQHLVLQYAKFYIDLTDDIEDELTKVFNNCKGYIEKAVVENDRRKRKKLVNMTFALIADFLLKEVKKSAQPNNGQPSDDAESSSGKKSENAANNSESDGQNKNDPQEQESQDQQKNNSSDSKGEESDADSNSSKTSEKMSDNGNNSSDSAEEESDTDDNDSDSEKEETDTDDGSSSEKEETDAGNDDSGSEEKKSDTGDDGSDSTEGDPELSEGEPGSGSSKDGGGTSDEESEEDSTPKNRTGSSETKSSENGDSSDSSDNSETGDEPGETSSSPSDNGNEEISPEELGDLLKETIDSLLSNNDNTLPQMSKNQNTRPVGISQMNNLKLSDPNEMKDLDFSENQTDLSYLSQMVEAEVDAERERSRIEKKMKEIADDIRRVRYDKCPSIERYYNPTEYGEEKYNNEHAFCDTVARRVVKNLDRVLKERKKGDYDNGLYVGKMLDSKHAYRKDRRIMQNKILPEDTPNLEVCVLVDCSGSMISTHKGISRIDYARKCAYITWKFCQIMNIPCSIYGHTTCDVGNVEKVDIRCFAHPESKDSLDGKRIFSLEPLNCNRDGWAINFCCEAFITDADTKKLLFIISDGLPNAEGYNYAERDMREVVAKYKKKGIKIFAAGIGEVSSIRNIYINNVPEKERAVFMDFSEIEALPKSFAKIIKDELK